MSHVCKATQFSEKAELGHKKREGSLFSAGLRQTIEIKMLGKSGDIILTSGRQQHPSSETPWGGWDSCR